MVDFSLLKTPNFATAALGGYEAGQQIQQQRAKAALEARQQRDAEAAIGARAKVFSAPAALGPVTPPAPVDGAMAGPVTPEGMGSAAPAPAMPQRADGLAINWDALRDYAKLDPDGATKIATFAATADKSRLDLTQKHGELKARAAFALRNMPEEQRATAFQAMVPQLAQMGFDPADLANARLDNASLDRDIAFGLTVTDMINQADKERTFAAAQADRAADNARADRSLASQESARAEALRISRERLAKNPSGVGAIAGSMSDDALLGALLGGNN